MLVSVRVYVKNVNITNRNMFGVYCQRERTGRCVFALVPFPSVLSREGTGQNRVRTGVEWTVAGRLRVFDAVVRVGGKRAWWHVPAYPRGVSYAFQTSGGLKSVTEFIIDSVSSSSDGLCNGFARFPF